MDEKLIKGLMNFKADLSQAVEKSSDVQRCLTGTLTRLNNYELPLAEASYLDSLQALKELGTILRDLRGKMEGIQ